MADRLFTGRVFGSKRFFLGFVGEFRALRFLKRNGLKIVAWRDQTGSAEIDLIALDNKTLVAVEVKTLRKQPQELRSRVKDQQLRRIKKALSQFTRARGYFPESTRIDMVMVILPSLFSRGEFSWLQNLTFKESNKTIR